MSVNRREIEAGVDDVWAVLADGWTYPSWVVGASRMRAVDAHWPSVGAKLHHSVGSWPALLDDETEVLAAEPERSLTLGVRAWPFGEGRVEVVLEPTARGCTVTMTERAVAGPGSLLPDVLQDVVLRRRNTESLQRLAFLAVGRHRDPAATGTSAP